MTAIYDFISIFMEIFIDMSYYMLFGLMFVALLNIFFTKELIVRYLGKDNLWSVIKASLLGVPLPLCSCGVIPTVVYMAKSGASRGAVISFLVSTPQTGIDSIVATYGMMGPFVAVFRPISALFTGIISGSIVQRIKFSSENFFKHKELNTITEKQGESCCTDGTSCCSTEGEDSCCSTESGDSCCTDDSCSCGTTKKPKNKYLRGLHYAFVEFFDDLAIRFLVGIFIAAMISFFVPMNYFADSGFNSGILGMLLMLAIGIPMYICATASIPIAVSLIIAGFSPGVAFVFIFAGPATNAATLAILFKAIGRKTVMLYLSILVVLAILNGYLLDYLLAVFDIDLNLKLMQCSHCSPIANTPWEYLSAVIFAGLILSALYRIYTKKYKKDKTMDQNISVKYLKVGGMNCSHCSGSVQRTLSAIPGLSDVKVDHVSGIAEYKGDADVKMLIDKITEIGYTAEEMKK